MSVLLDITQKLQATQDMIRKTKELVSRHPKEYSLLANLESLENRAFLLEENFLLEANIEQLDVCTYRMIAQDRRSYPILAVGSALSELQKWFSTVYDSLKSGPKLRAKLAPEVVQQSSFDFAFAFTGSVGVAMTIPSERLFVDNNLQIAMQKTIEMAKSENRDQIRNFAKEFGVASIRAMSRWVSAHVESDVGAEIKWLRDRAEIISGFFETHHLSNLEQAIKETSEETEETIKVVGNLIGADIQKHTFHIEVADADEIRGTMADSIGMEYTVELPKRYLAVLRKISYLNYAKDEESTKYHLLELKSPHQNN